MKIFQERLRACRENTKKTQQTVAEEMEIPYRSYRRYESGESEPTLSPLVKLAAYYGVSLDYLAGISDDP